MFWKKKKCVYGILPNLITFHINFLFPSVLIFLDSAWCHCFSCIMSLIWLHFHILSQATFFLISFYYIWLLCMISINHILPNLITFHILSQATSTNAQSNFFFLPSLWSEGIPTKIWPFEGSVSGNNHSRSHQGFTRRQENFEERQCYCHWASSGLGLATAKALAETGKWHVIMTCRDFLKAERAAKSAGIAKEIVSLDSVRQFVDNFRQSGRPLDVLVCNAAVYLPTAREPTYTADGFELSVGTNQLGHFLLSRLLLEDLNKSDYPSKWLIIVGSITGIIH